MNPSRTLVLQHVDIKISSLRIRQILERGPKDGRVRRGWPFVRVLLVQPAVDQNIEVPVGVFHFLVTFESVDDYRLATMKPMIKTLLKDCSGSSGEAFAQPFCRSIKRVGSTIFFEDITVCVSSWRTLKALFPTSSSVEFRHRSYQIATDLIQTDAYIDYHSEAHSIDIFNEILTERSSSPFYASLSGDVTIYYRNGRPFRADVCSPRAGRLLIRGFVPTVRKGKDEIYCGLGMYALEDNSDGQEEATGLVTPLVPVGSVRQAPLIPRQEDASRADAPWPDNMGSITFPGTTVLQSPSELGLASSVLPLSIRYGPSYAKTKALDATCDANGFPSPWGKRVDSQWREGGEEVRSPLKWGIYPEGVMDGTWRTTMLIASVSSEI